MSYKVIPISNEICNEVRETLISPQYKHPASVSIATGYGPCRSCLNTFNEGEEERILFTYNSFEGLSDLPLPGPVFIHKDECRSHDDDVFPQGLSAIPVLFEGFGECSHLIVREPIDADQTDAQIERIFSREDIRYINIRNAEAGCFVARIDCM